jgi:hypothetical protein
MTRLLWAPLTMALAACGPTGSEGEFVVGPGGGTFEHLGVRLIVPANAVASETTITLSVVVDNIPEVPDRKRISLGYRLGPASVKLQAPIQLEIPYVEAWLPAQGIDPSSYDIRRATVDNPYLALGSPNTIVERKVVSAHSDRVGLFWVTSPLEPPSNEVRITPSQANLRVGQTQQFGAEVLDPAGRVLSGVTVSWSIAPARVARVDSRGLVEALAPGTATLTATSGDQSARAPVYVVGDTVGPSTFVHENPFPTGNDLLGGAVAGNEAFFVGGNGTILSRSETNHWTRQLSAPAIELQAIAVPAAGWAVAVGLGVSDTTGRPTGVLVEIGGGNPSPSLQMFTSIQPRAIWFDGAHGMAVGYGNDVLVRRNGGWATEYSPSFETLLDVEGDGAGGFVTVGDLGSLYRFDPATQTWDSLFDTRLSVLLVSAVIAREDGSEAWAVGGNKLWHFQNAAWSAINLPTSPAFEALTAVGIIDERVVIGARNGASGSLFVYNPATREFTSSVALRGPQIARSIIGMDGSGYAVGDGGAVWQYANGTFNELSRGFYGDVMDVYATPALTVAVVNECANADCTARVGRVRRRTPSGTWEELGPQPFTRPLFSVAVRSSTEVFAGGHGVVWRYDGASWTPTTLAAPGKVNDLSVCGPNVWGVGDQGLILTGQSQRSQVTTRDLWAVTCRDASEIWIAGDGILFAVRGSTAVAAYDPDVRHAPYRSVWTPGSNEAYAFGEARYGVYWNGQNLLVYDMPGGILPDIIADLWGSSADNLYAVGSTVTPLAFGYAIRFNGAQWSLVDAGAHRPANAIHGSSPLDVYIVTDGGGILRALPPR